MIRPQIRLSENTILIAIPFLLTTIFIFVGYQLLTRSAPEAQVAQNLQQAQAEIITDSDFTVTKPQVPIPQTLNFYLAQIPDKQLQLDKIIDAATKQAANGIYFYLPVDLKEDYTLEPAGVHQTNLENITRWVKKSVSRAHAGGFQVVFALTYNATTTVSDDQKFISSLQSFLPRWSGVANEVSVAFFNPGITIGHPLYSQLTDAQVSQILRQTQNVVRQGYSGRIGVGLCCTQSTQVNPGGYSFIVAIPTPEYQLELITPPVKSLVNQLNMSHTLLFDRSNQVVSSLNP